NSWVSMLDVSEPDLLCQQPPAANRVHDPFEGLADFFEAIKHHPLTEPALASQRQPASRATTNIVLDGLDELLANLDEAMTAQRQVGSLFDAWDVLGLGRHEVRSCQVLKWLFTADESHGLGALALDGLLDFLGETGKAMPSTPPWMPLPAAVSEKCDVQAEKSYGPDNKMRLDILVDDPGFVLIIEAKVGHRESVDQLKTYASECERRIGSSRPWLLL